MSRIASVVLHVLFVIFLFSQTAHGPAEKPDVPRVLLKPAKLIQPVFLGDNNAGGGGGNNSLTLASFGRLPRPAPRQFVPPTTTPPPTSSLLTIEPALVSLTEIKLPDVSIANYGDPFGKHGPPSDGPGKRGGIGAGENGGIGNKRGPGAGSGDKTGIQGRFEFGGATAPVLIYKVEPEFSEDARKAKLQGVVLFQAEIDSEGRVCKVRLIHGLGLGLDEKAMEAVMQWRFRPGIRNGKPVAVPATIEVNFRLL